METLQSGMTRITLSRRSVVIDSRKSVVRAVASVAGTDWRLGVSRPTSGYILIYLVEGAAIWMVLFVAIAFVTLGFRVLKAVASELKHVGRFLC